MSNTESWVDTFIALVGTISGKLITGNEFNNIVLGLCDSAESQYCAIQFEVFNSMSGKPTKKYGCSQECPADISEKIQLNGSWICMLNAWRNPNVNIVEVRLKDLFMAYWKEDCRSEKAHIISKQQQKSNPLCQKLLSSPSELPFTVFAFGDLDNFKQVNDFVGTDHGDRIIAEFGTILTETFGDEGVVVHNSGDEFVIIFRCALLDEALLSLYRGTNSVREHEFDVKTTKSGYDERNKRNITVGEKIHIDVSFGATYFTDEEDVPSWEDLYIKAEETMSKKQDNGFKGTARISHYYDKGSQPTAQEPDNYKSAYLLAKASIDTSAPFPNIWLNTLSILISRLSIDEEVENEVQRFLSWMQNSSYEGIVFSAKSALPDLTPEISNIEVIMAISHGLARSKTISSITWKMHDGKLSVVSGANSSIVEFPISDCDIAETVFLSQENYEQIQKMLNDECWAKRALLIQIGHNASPLPSSLFFETITVDDRPTRGGALPDFWERVLAQLVVIINNNKNITHIVVCGEKSYGLKIIQLINGIVGWSSEHIQWLSEKTKSEISQLEEVKHRLSNTNNIISEDDTTALINKLFDLYSAENEYYLVKTLPESFPNRILARNAILETDTKLKDSDGIRIPTICEAYPIMLDIVRSMRDDNTILHLTDQAGEEFLELTDFKVHLTNPTVEMVPYFFAKHEQKDLDEYYNKAFEAGGLFLRELTTGDPSQYEQVLSHLSETISDVKRKFSTRRAVLVIPHNVAKDVPLSPLGLISVRIMPAFEGKIVRINYSYTWRTVEAVVGFPYSIYGSVKFSQSITKDLEQRIEKTNPTIVTKMGTVSYIAHSLHMFTDIYTQEIIRGIINDASK